jgi:Tol biopolymer transport system component
LVPLEAGRIIFASKEAQCWLFSHIYIMNSNGGNVRQLTSFRGAAENPSWSPDGTRIALTRYESPGSGCSLYLSGSVNVMNSDGSGLVRLRSGYGPNWSPDGQRIVFYSEDDNIFVMNPDGSNVVQLTNNSASDSDPVWSPDGNKIAFSSRQNGKTHVYVMNSDGSGVRRLTNHSAGYATDPAWSPDGSRIAFHFNPSESWGSSSSEIYVMNATGSGVLNLTNSPGFDGNPAWSPGGNFIVFDSSRSGDRDIYAMRADGTSQRRLYDNSVNDFEPDWHR